MPDFASFWRYLAFFDLLNPKNSPQNGSKMAFPFCARHRDTGKSNSGHMGRFLRALFQVAGHFFFPIIWRNFGKPLGNPPPVHFFQKCEIGSPTWTPPKNEARGLLFVFFWGSIAENPRGVWLWGGLLFGFLIKKSTKTGLPAGGGGPKIGEKGFFGNEQKKSFKVSKNFSRSTFAVLGGVYFLDFPRNPEGGSHYIGRVLLLDFCWKSAGGFLVGVWFGGGVDLPATSGDVTPPPPYGA